MRMGSPSTERVQSVVDTPKALVKRLSWVRKHGNRNPPRFEFYTAVNLDTGATLEGVTVRAEWRKSPIPGLQPTYSFGLHCDIKYRVYAVDVNSHSPHINKKHVGIGLPFFGQKIGGTHEHIWTGEYGYAEPLSNDTDMEGHWIYFCQKANIVVASGFTSPDFDSITGQGRLL